MTTRLIRWFVARYGVDMSEAADPDIASYASFNDFFTRPLKAGARPLAPADFVCPVDGAISQLGAIDDYHIVQAKGHLFTHDRPDRRRRHAGGGVPSWQFREPLSFAAGLSPPPYAVCRQADPHDLHSRQPVLGKPGHRARLVPNLFARNERVVCVFDSPEHGPFVMVLVGATIVGSMETVWHGVVNPARGGGLAEWRYDDQDIVLEQGAEMGRFLLGSTIVMLFRPGTIAFDESWTPERPVRLGERMGDRPR